MEINGIEVDVDLRYSEMNLSQGILKALDQKGFTLATPVQAGAIPCFKDWKDVMAKAPTGSGKTFAFGIPMVEHTDPEGTEVTGLVLAPHPGAGPANSGGAAPAVRLSARHPGGLPLRRPAH